MALYEHEVPGRTRILRIPVDEPNPSQLTLDADAADRNIDNSIDAHWRYFDQQNPHVYEAIVEFARIWQKTGKTRCSMNMIFEVLRADYGMQTIGDLDFKLNNNWRSRYTRKLQEDHPVLGEMFETRELKAR